MPRALRRLTRRRAQQGAAAVEFALVFPLLIMLIFGLVTTGMVFFDHSSATNAVREAARYGAATDYTSGSWAASVRDRVKQTYFKTIDTVTDAQICVDLTTASGTTLASASGSNCGAAPAAPTTVPSGSCVVRVWLTKPETISLIVFPSMNFNIGAASVEYYGRTAPATGTPQCTAN